MKKRGQVTAFIIVGILMVLAAMVFFYMKSDMYNISDMGKVPEALIPLQRFIEECAGNTARTAIGMASAKGGWLELPQEIQKNPFARLSVVPDAGMYIPYWYYHRSGMEGKDLSPTQKQMEEQLSVYIQNQLPNCINNFTAFQNIYKVKEEGNITAQVQLTDNSVVVLIDYPLAVTDASKKQTKMRKERVEVPIRLKTMYELGRKIFEEENNALFLEEMTIGLMSLNEEVIPMTDVKVQCNPYVKPISQVKRNLKALVKYNFPYIRINNTYQSPYVIDTDAYANYHLRKTIEFNDFEKQNYQDLIVDFVYEEPHFNDWPMFMTVTPNRAGFLKAEPLKLVDISLPVDLPGLGKSISVPACVVQTHFVYDVEFPVMIKITDEQTKDHEAAVFQFVMPVVINHNQGDKEGYPVRLMPENEGSGSEEDYCRNYPLTDNIKITTVDRLTNQQVDGANITFKCMVFNCEIGQTEFYQGSYELNAKVPQCSYATITARSPDFFDSQLVGIATKTDKIINLAMLPKQSINYTIVKYKPGESTKYVLESDETALIDIKNDKYNYSKSFIKSKDSGNDMIELIKSDGLTYAIDMYLVKGETLIGGYSGNWTVSERELLNAGEAKIPAFYFEDVAGNEQLSFEIMSNMTDLSKKIPKPKLE